MFGESYPRYRSEQIRECVNKAAIYIENNQKNDGSWFAKRHHLFSIQNVVLKQNVVFYSATNNYIDSRYGTWGICFIYGTLFAIKGLVAVGRTYENSACIRKACNFLLSTQLKTGGWGESYLSCEHEVNNCTFFFSYTN